MDTYRGNYLDQAAGEDWPEIEFGNYESVEAEDEGPREPPPSPIGQDERRMQVRAYNYWASLLEERSFPAIEDLNPHDLPDFGPYSVMLDFTGGIENPGIRFLGDMLAQECGTEGRIESLSDVPARSLLSRITDHYMQILANQAPIGFEAEFVNQRGRTILYRGILLPFSSDNETIDFIYGVINWKELADHATTEELLQEIDQALDDKRGTDPREPDEITEWADGPADALVETPDIHELTEALDPLELEVPGESADADAEDVLELADVADEPSHHSFDRFAMTVGADEGDDEDDDGSLKPLDFAAYTSAPAVADDDALELTELADEAAESEHEIALAEIADADMGLADWLASARELADVARGSEDRTRSALYEAIGKAYDFSLAAAEAPAEFAELVADSGLTVQDRAPMTPVVKLVFGADYDKTRLTEYASALSHAQRIGLTRGALAPYLAAAPGGLKGVIAEERRIKREEAGKDVAPRDCPREALAKQLRALDHVPLAEVPGEGAEFTLLVARRLPDGTVVLLGEVSDDIPLLEKAAKKLLG